MDYAPVCGWFPRRSHQNQRITGEHGQSRLALAMSCCHISLTTFLEANCTTIFGCRPVIVWFLPSPPTSLCPLHLRCVPRELFIAQRRPYVKTRLFLQTCLSMSMKGISTSASRKIPGSVETADARVKLSAGRRRTQRL